MRDIGEVRNAAQIQTNKVRINGAAQVYIPIYRQPGENTLRIIREIKEQLSTILTRLQTEVEDPRMGSLVLSVAMDQSGDVENRINSLMLAGLLGAALAGLVVLLFLRSFRLTFVVLLSIPLAVFVAIVGLFASEEDVIIQSIIRSRHRCGAETKESLFWAEGDIGAHHGPAGRAVGCEGET